MYSFSKLLVFVLLTAVPSAMLSMECAPEITWNQSFLLSEDQTARSVSQMSDGGFMITGSTGSFAHENVDLLLFKVDGQGKEVWKHIYGGEGEDRGFSLKHTRDGAFIIVGKSDSWNEGDQDLFLLKVSADGSLLWSQTYGGGREDIGFSVTESRTGDYIIAGSSKSFGDGSLDAWLIRTSSAGNELWSQSYGWFGSEVLSSVIGADDGSILAVGSTDSLDTQTQIMALKASSEGNDLLVLTYPETECITGKEIQKARSGGFIIVGGAYESMSDQYDLCLIRIDANGKLLWHRTIDQGGEEIGYSVQSISDGGFIALGVTTSQASQRMLMVKVDANGKEVWRKIYPALYGSGAGFSLLSTFTNGFVLSGHNTAENGDFDLWMIRTDQEGRGPINTEEEVVQE